MLRTQARSPRSGAGRMAALGLAVVALTSLLAVAPVQAASSGPFDGRYQDRHAKVTMLCSNGTRVVKESPILFSVERTVIYAGKKQIGTVSTSSGRGRITFTLSGITTTGPVTFTTSASGRITASGKLSGVNPPCTFTWRFTAPRLP